MLSLKKGQLRSKICVRKTNVYKIKATSLNSNEFFFSANSKKVNAVIVSNTERVEISEKDFELGILA